VAEVAGARQVRAAEKGVVCSAVARQAAVTGIRRQARRRQEKCGRQAAEVAA